MKMYFNRDNFYYQIISKFYNSEMTQRSKIPLIRHINEGLRILTALQASKTTHQAFCLHPIIEGEHDLARVLDDPTAVCRVSLGYAQDFAAAASHFRVDDYSAGLRPDVAGLPTSVLQMLIADKVQNRKDFTLYHRHTHPRAADLEGYFVCWLNHLGVDQTRYRELAGIAESADTNLVTKINNTLGRPLRNHPA